MIPLHGLARRVRLLAPLPRTVWRICTEAASPSSSDAFLVTDGCITAPAGFALYFVRAGAQALSPARASAIELPEELSYLEQGDIVGISPDGRRVDVLWRRKSPQNSILLTEQCDNYCLMCSQPPKQRDDQWLRERAAEIVRLLPPEARGLILTGGEPTLDADRFISLLTLCTQVRPDIEIHTLSNGRRFSDPAFASAYAAVDNPRMMVGIPLFGAERTLHDFVVQAAGAFDETVRGILNLISLGQRVELRVVIHRQTAPALVEITRYIARNLPFVEQVALMGLEPIGLVRANVDDVWIDPWDYREILTEATLLLHTSGIRTMIYNHQLCVIDPRVWNFAVCSISDWKNEYAAACQECSVMNRCGGFFSSARFKVSAHVGAIKGGDNESGRCTI